MILVIILIICIVLLLCTKRINPQYICIIERCGKFHKTVSGKWIFLIPFIDTIRKIEHLGPETIHMIPQPVISQDNHTLLVNCAITYLIIDYVKATYEIASLKKGLEYLAITSLRDIIGQINSDQINESRDSIIRKLEEILRDSASKWGTEIESIDFYLEQK